MPDPFALAILGIMLLGLIAAIVGRSGRAAQTWDDEAELYWLETESTFNDWPPRGS